jgi:hypothetical protein
MFRTSGLKKLIAAAKEQLLAAGPLTDNLTVTEKCTQQAKQLGLTEADVKAIYTQGAVVPNYPYLVSKRFNGYSLTISYFRSSRSGYPVITSIRKRVN